MAGLGHSSSWLGAETGGRGHRWRGEHGEQQRTVSSCVQLTEMQQEMLRSMVTRTGAGGGGSFLGVH